MKNLFYLLILLCLFYCCKGRDINSDLTNKTGATEIYACRCSSSDYRYLIVTYEKKDTVYYNPVNLSDNYKDKNYKIIFSANLLNDSSIVYTNLPNDAIIESFRVRNIQLTAIKITSD